jgi:hypothetical protein
MNPRCKIPREKRDALVEIYRQVGMKGVEPFAKEAGVTAKYIANVAGLEGYRRQPNQRRTEQDPRWAWAIKRGAIRA